ncbi:hypothetical protein [Peribacillus glennii]|uniref:Surface layer protein A domain-containing protein n=1 Tax=Peribacillus glennii TaxID=2303991 RepID=A0A372L782_9BACI|nr:hypothetical protein [Peribacillus glennii]RFU61096.1 hypothetical protein D0466_19115 [Peribacillus glennii]
MRKFQAISFLIAFVLLFSFAMPNQTSAKVMWGKVEVTTGMTGKVEILKDTDLLKKDSNGKFIKSGKAKKGKVYRTVSYKSPYYGLEKGLFIKKTSSIRYTAIPETLLIDKQLEKTPANKKLIWGKVEIKKGMTGKATVLKNTTLWKLDKKKKPVKYKTVKAGSEIRIYSYNSKTKLYKSDSGVYIKNDKNIKYTALKLKTVTDLQKKLNETDELDVITIE